MSKEKHTWENNTSLVESTRHRNKHTKFALREPFGPHDVYFYCTRCNIYNILNQKFHFLCLAVDLIYNSHTI